MKFSKLGLSQQLEDVLEQMGFLYPTEIQQQIIPQVLGGRDVVGRSQTGSGKTFACGHYAHSSPVFVKIK